MAGLLAIHRALHPIAQRPLRDPWEMVNRFFALSELYWGYAQWAQPLINGLTDGVAGISDDQARQLLDDRYHRLQGVLDPSEAVALDAVDKRDRMDEIARAHPLDALPPGASHSISPVAWICTVWPCAGATVPTGVAVTAIRAAPPPRSAHPAPG